MKYYAIDGFWKDTNENFSERIVASKEYTDGVPDYIDEQIFFYGLTQEDLQDYVVRGWNTDLEFIITGFEETEV